MADEDVATLFDRFTAESREIFEAKLDEYGPSFLVFRPRSLVDRLWTKARRIRRLEEVGDDRQVDEGRREEYLGLLNYTAIGLMKAWYADDLPAVSDDLADADTDRVLDAYDRVLDDARELMTRKNHDYGAAWREMHISSITDVILDKLVRMRSMAEHDPDGWTEDLTAELVDVLNYVVFSLAKLDAE